MIPQRKTDDSWATPKIPNVSPINLQKSNKKKRKIEDSKGKWMKIRKKNYNSKREDLEEEDQGEDERNVIL